MHDILHSMRVHYGRVLNTVYPVYALHVRFSLRIIHVRFSLRIITLYAVKFTEKQVLDCKYAEAEAVPRSLSGIDIHMKSKSSGLKLS